MSADDADAGGSSTVDGDALVLLDGVDLGVVTPLDVDVVVVDVSSSSSPTSLSRAAPPAYTQTQQIFLKEKRETLNFKI